MLEAGRGLADPARRRDRAHPRRRFRGRGRGLRSGPGRARGVAPAAAARLGEAPAPHPHRAAGPAARRRRSAARAPGAAQARRQCAQIHRPRRLSISASNPRPAPDGRRFVRFVIADTGHGVAREVAARLFKPFSPGDNSYTRSQQGAGLGPCRRQAHRRAGGRRHRLRKRAGRGRAILVHPAGVRPCRRHGADAEAPAMAKPAARRPPIFRSSSALRTANIAVRIANLLEPFGNHARGRADHRPKPWRAPDADGFDAIITGAGDADLIAAAPGVKAPVIAVLLRGDRAPALAREILRWPVAPDALYTALDAVAAHQRARGTAAPARPKPRRSTPGLQHAGEIGRHARRSSTSCNAISQPPRNSPRRSNPPAARRNGTRPRALPRISSARQAGSDSWR